MSYRERLSYWAVVRLLPNQQWSVVARFRNRSDADGHARFLQQYMPPEQIRVVFEVPAIAVENPAAAEKTIAAESPEGDLP